MAAFMKTQLQSAYEGISSAYLWALGRPLMQPVNNLVLNMALRAKGYANHQDFWISGERRLVERLGQQKPRLCVDVGSNAGDYSRLLLEHTEAQVLAFDPLPGAKRAARRLQAQFPGRFRFVEKGVAARAGEMEIAFDGDCSPVASFLTDLDAFDQRSRSQRLLRSVVSLDEFFAQDPDLQGAEVDFLKIDVEGLEHEVLQGMQGCIADQRIRSIQLEYNTHQMARGQSLFSLAQLLPGYSCYRLLPHGSQPWVRVSPRDYTSNFYTFANYVFSRDTWL